MGHQDQATIDVLVMTTHRVESFDDAHGLVVVEGLQAPLTSAAVSETAAHTPHLALESRLIANSDDAHGLAAVKVLQTPLIFGDLLVSPHRPFVHAPPAEEAPQALLQSGVSLAPPWRHSVDALPVEEAHQGLLMIDVELVVLYVVHFRHIRHSIRPQSLQDDLD